MEILIPQIVVTIIIASLAKLLVTKVSHKKGPKTAGWAAAGFYTIIFGFFAIFAAIQVAEAVKQNNAALMAQEVAKKMLRRQ